MTIIYPTGKYEEDDRRNKPDQMAYNLAEEKALIAEATEEIKQELLAKWQKRYANAEIFPANLAKLNPELAQYLLAYANTETYNRIAKENNFNAEQRDKLPQVVWNTVLNQQWDGVKTLAASSLNLSDESMAVKITGDLENNILAEAKKIFAKRTFFSVRKKEAPKNSNLPISEAITVYRKLGDQLITNSPIKIAQFPAPARPSIKNWIVDYRQKAGAQKHGMVERGNFIFNSENAKGLSSGERQKVAFILKSLDENFPLEIDKINERVIFPEAKAGQENIISSKDKNISFSSGHSFATERKDMPRTNTSPQNSGFRNNVVDLKN